MHLDARGLPLSTASAKAAAAYDHVIVGYLTQRADTPARLTALLEADPDFALWVYELFCSPGLADRAAPPWLNAEVGDLNGMRGRLPARGTD